MRARYCHTFLQPGRFRLFPFPHKLSVFTPVRPVPRRSPSFRIIIRVLLSNEGPTRERGATKCGHICGRDEILSTSPFINSFNKLDRKNLKLILCIRLLESRYPKTVLFETVFRSNVHTSVQVVRRYSRICLSGRTDGEECAAASSSLSRLVTIIQHPFVRIASIVFYFSFLRTMIPLFENERGLVGYLLKIGFLFYSRIVDLRGTHEHSRSIKSPLANGTRVDREEEGGVFFSFLKNDIVSKIRIDFFSPLSFLPSSLRVLLNVRVTFAPRCGGGDEHRVQLER